MFKTACLFGVFLCLFCNVMVFAHIDDFATRSYSVDTSVEIIQKGVNDDASCELKKRFRINIPASQSYRVYAAAHRVMDRGLALKKPRLDVLPCFQVR